jgi:hypothetical protein
MENFEKFFKKVDDTIEYNPEKLKQGIKVETEHTDNKKIAEIIAKHHLAENPEYYTKLKKMESEFENEN